MGKQVRFFTLPTDEIKLIDFVLSLPGAYFIKVKTLQQKVEVVDRNSILNLAEVGSNHLLIAQNSLPISQSDITEIRAITYSEEKLDFIETGETFYSVSMNAPVVEFSRSFIREDNKLVQGRIWCELYRLTDDHLEFKGEEFRNLFETLSKWIKRNFKKIQGIDGYFGEEAEKWHKSGGQYYPP